MRKTGIVIIIALIIAIVAVFLFMPREKELVEVRLAYLKADIHHLPAWVAIEKRFYKEEGIMSVVSGVYTAGPEEMKGFSEKKQDIGSLLSKIV